MDILFWVLLVVVALGVGLYLGYQWRRNREPNNPVKFHRDYLAGLNFLLNEQPDKAVDIFIKMLKVDKDTVETHISLGNLFRRRGEVNRALRIHQNLLDGGELNKEQRMHALIELGYDYLSAGVFDRAENIFAEVIQLDETQAGVLASLLDIYEKEKDWESAVKIAQKIELATGKPMHAVIAQYYCELAENCFHQKQATEAMQALKQAQKSNKRCVRASLLMGKAEMAQGQYKQALKTLQRVRQQDPVFLSEAIQDIVACYQQLQDEKGLEDYLQQCIHDYPDIPFILILSEKAKQLKGRLASEAFVMAYVRRNPSFSGLKLLLDKYLASNSGEVQQDLTALVSIIDKLLQKKPKYRCSHCGFVGQSLHWQCIGCKRWSTMKPLHGEEF